MPPGYHLYSEDRNAVPKVFFWVRERDGNTTGPFDTEALATADAQRDYAESRVVH
jgi:hypothetical protein